MRRRANAYSARGTCVRAALRMMFLEYRYQVRIVPARVGKTIYSIDVAWSAAQPSMASQPTEKTRLSRHDGGPSVDAGGGSKSGEVEVGRQVLVVGVDGRRLAGVAWRGSGGEELALADAGRRGRGHLRRQTEVLENP
jgi:hypothetical protein